MKAAAVFIAGAYLTICVIFIGGWIILSEKGLGLALACRGNQLISGLILLVVSFGFVGIVAAIFFRFSATVKVVLVLAGIEAVIITPTIGWLIVWEILKWTGIILGGLIVVIACRGGGGASSGGRTQHYDNRGRAVGHSEHSGDTSTHYDDIGRQQGYSKHSDDKATHYNRRGGPQGYSRDE